MLLDEVFHESSNVTSGKERKRLFEQIVNCSGPSERIGNRMARVVHMGPAKCNLDLGDGSERGAYVGQDHILNVLGRPHRMVNIMYTYYPNDKQWPQRISEACADMDVSFAWDYPYDDYPTFCEGGTQFEQMRDIRRHGQDIMLTITIDCSVDDSHIRQIAKSLSSFGRMWARPNHECNGDWFTHNKRFSREEIAAFFVRFSRIMKEEAPNVKCVFCAGLICDEPDKNGDYKVEFEDEFAPAYEAADVWSADKYLMLHYGWPYDVAEAGGGSYTIDDAGDVFGRFERTYKRLSDRFGKKPFIQAEFNADGDITGPLKQGEYVRRYYDLVRDNNASWLNGISMYQFRDRGRLGLEREDEGNPSVGIRQPLMDEYRKIMSDEYFVPSFSYGGDARFPANLRWGGSTDSDGIEIMIDLDKTPQFCEAVLQENLSLMLEFNGRWFYKARGVSDVDLMAAFFDENISGAKSIPLRIFATPPDGENHTTGCDDWRVNQFYVMESEPAFRIRYETPLGSIS